MSGDPHNWVPAVQPRASGLASPPPACSSLALGRHLRSEPVDQRPLLAPKIQLFLKIYI